MQLVIPLPLLSHRKYLNMNSYLILLVLATFGFTFGTDLQKCREMIECVRRAMNGGIPDIGLPDFNPLKIPHKRIDLNMYLANGTLNFTDVVISNLVNFEVKELVDLGGENDSNIAAFNYSLFWPKVRVTAEYSQNLTLLNLGHYAEKAHIDLTLEESHFNGTWNMTLGNQPELNDFYLEPYTENILDDSYIIPDNIIQRFLKTMAIESLNNVFKYDRNELGDYISPFIERLLNEDWIVGGRERINVIMNKCKNKQGM